MGEQRGWTFTSGHFVIHCRSKGQRLAREEAMASCRAHVFVPSFESPFEDTSCSPVAAQKVKKEGSLKSSQMNVLLLEGFQFHTTEAPPLLPYRVFLSRHAEQTCPRKGQQLLAEVALSREKDSFGRLNEGWKATKWESIASPLGICMQGPQQHVPFHGISIPFHGISMSLSMEYVPFHGISVSQTRGLLAFSPLHREQLIGSKGTGVEGGVSYKTMLSPVQTLLQLSGDLRHDLVAFSSFCTYPAFQWCPCGDSVAQIPQNTKDNYT